MATKKAAAAAPKRERTKKVVYWLAANEEDPSYGIRALTRRECKSLLREATEGGGQNDFLDPVKVTIEYVSGFDLVYQLLGEGGRAGR